MVLHPDDGRWRTGVIARYYRNKALESGYLSYEEAIKAPRSSPATRRPTVASGKPASSAPTWMAN